ncbi:hypothetical protein [Clostridium sp. FP1]|uniref:hypothetical protein n=1 Tax=Clostridium sp. FP1 TaxID=2724076 RepID=UPI00165201A0|nr:hypothetical protein [Clostridium sp. FP1]MBZ9635490.1 hypothetical protein [Clostridium sp. FP1]
MYPENVDKFTEKLNKLENNTYVIEEEVTLANGIYEGELEHDNVSLPSISVYTGSKLTGNKIENFILSTPSKTPWKKEIKIFSNMDKVYITYQTNGDTVEADDINKVQESIVITQVEVDKYKASNNLEVGNLKVRATNLENNKAEKTYVDIELNKRYLKEQVFTREEVLQKIKDVIGVAPDALDTLQEIAKSLNNDADFAGTITKGLATKVDKVAGKQLSSEDYSTGEKQKLAGIETNANKYIHPSSHSADIVVENENRRFTSDIEKQVWGNKETPESAQSKANIVLKTAKEYADAMDSKHAGEFASATNINTTGETKLGAVDASQFYTTHMSSNQVGLYLSGNTLNIPFKTSDGTLRTVTIDGTKLIATANDVPTKLSQLQNDANYLKKGVTWNDLKGV